MFSTLTIFKNRFFENLVSFIAVSIPQELCFTTKHKSLYNSLIWCVGFVANYGRIFDLQKLLKPKR